MKISLRRLNKAFNFEAKNEDGAVVQMDGSPDIGGENKGLRPMQLLIAAIGGCSAIDIGLILKKQRQEIDDFQIEIDADRETGVEPALWKNVHIKFMLKGNIEKEKALRAVDLSMKKYCSVSATLEKAGAAITWEVFVNGR